MQVKEIIPHLMDYHLLVADTDHLVVLAVMVVLVAALLVGMPLTLVEELQLLAKEIEEEIIAP
jgi:hypothetical protein